MKRIMIGGASSSVGKTTISLGIMAALSKRGIKVAPFKVGPDFIDPGFHKFVCDNPSYNLDSWLMSKERIRFLFERNMEGKDIGIIEGVMGLYDGFGVEKDNGSSAHLAKIIDAPVILVIDGSGISSSAAAMVLGYKFYDQDLTMKGVIINKVSGEQHYNILKEAIEKHVKIPCLGYLPVNSEINLKSRHLGLIPSNEISTLEDKLEKLTELVENCIDLGALLDLAKSSSSKKYVQQTKKLKNPIEKYKFSAEGLRIGIAMDKAFNFYYEDNLKLLKEIGIKLIPFSPIKDIDLPSDIDGIYIGGGFPEVFAKELEKNKVFRENIKKRLEDGLPAYVECGGLMYLTERIINLEGEYSTMAGFFPTITRMTKRLQRFGYVNIETDTGDSIKGHEFHHSLVEERANIDYFYKVYKSRNGSIEKEWRCGLKKINTLAAYPHIHFYSNPEFLFNLIRKIKLRR
ncbi:cobyrinate a,c-diamide synthase [Natronospora cellulosivora (SeqCode)]